MMDLSFDFEENTQTKEAEETQPQAKTVTELSNEIKRYVEGKFNHVLVRGEIFGAKRADSGHWYLSLKDEKLKDILSINKGGTGSDNFQGAANNILKDAAEATTMADSEFLYIYSGGNVKKLSLSSLNNILKASLPTGFIYIQLRGQSTPDVLFNTTGKWQDISSTYAGEFFRAVGGNSASFGSKQNEGLPTFNIVTDRAVQGQGKVLPKGEKLTSANKGLGGMASTQGYGGTSAVAIGTENTSFSQSPFPYFVPNNSIYGASTHVTPYNSAIRIWKKIS